MSFSLHTDIEKVMLFISTVFKFNSEAYTTMSESVNKSGAPPALPRGKQNVVEADMLLDHRPPGGWV
jgi:hypothetical protein